MLYPLFRQRLWLQVSLLGHVFVFGPNSGFSAEANQRQPSWTGIVRQTINGGPAIFWSFWLVCWGWEGVEGPESSRGFSDECVAFGATKEDR